MRNELPTLRKSSKEMSYPPFVKVRVRNDLPTLRKSSLESNRPPFVTVHTVRKQLLTLRKSS
jgi:hypothetical protein